MLGLVLEQLVEPRRVSIHMLRFVPRRYVDEFLPKQQTAVEP